MSKNLRKYIAFTLFLVVLLVGSILLISNGSSSNLQNTIPLDLSTYIDYKSNTKLLNENNVLFFKANWCSTCTVADNNFNKTLSKIPANLTIYKVNFEQELALRAKYGVTVQHTFVQVDENGNPLKKWVGSYTIEEVLNELV